MNMYLQFPARPRVRTRLCVWCHGELGAHSIQGLQPSIRPPRFHSPSWAACHYHHSSRDCSSGTLYKQVWYVRLYWHLLSSILFTLHTCINTLCVDKGIKCRIVDKTLISVGYCHLIWLKSYATVFTKPCPDCWGLSQCKDVILLVYVWNTIPGKTVFILRRSTDPPTSPAT